jgi:hypothetical protein
MNSIDPQTYLRDVLAKIVARHPMDRKRCRDHTSGRQRLVAIGSAIKLRGELWSSRAKPTAGVRRASGRASR